LGKTRAVVIDVGINHVDDATRPRGYRLVGDVCFEEVSQVGPARSHLSLEAWAANHCHVIEEHPACCKFEGLVL
jgi:hypothetical protein